jgi:spore coat protein CotH
VNKLDGNGLRLKKSKLTFVVMLSTLLLASMFFNVVQTSGANTDSWSGEDNIANEADVFFDDSYIHEIHLYFEDPNWYDTLYDAHDSNRTTSDPYFPARFESHDITIDPVGVRFKGLSTFGFNFGGGSFFGGWGGGEVEDEDIKKPFRIDFNMYDEEGAEETTFFGLKKLNLNNEALDPSLIREKLFMDFASNYVPAPRSAFTRVYVNDEYYGLYLAMEHIDNTFVESRFGDDEDGNLYKVEQQGTLAYFGPDPQSYYISYELKNNEEANDWSDLIQLTNVMTNTPIPELPDKLEPIFDVESAMYSMALLDLFVSGDSYIGNARNYYIYHRSGTGQFTHLLWDANLVFGNFGFGMGMGQGTDPTEYGVFPPSTIGGFGGGFFFGPPGGGEDTRNTLMLIKRVMAVESYNRTYLCALAQMLREGFDADSINARIQELADLIRDEVYSDPNLWTNLEDFEPELEAIVDFVEKRAAYVNAQLNVFARKTDLQLNDLMTVNQGTIADNMGEYDPWVEIYNLGPGLVNLGGLFLTDDLGVPDKWGLPIQNLDDGEFVLLWLDGEHSEGPYHAPFSLSSGGGDLYLYLRVGSDYVLVDSISYPALEADVSFGRFPDGEGLWHVLNEVVTPALSNQFDGIPENLYINEFMANNDAAVAGDYGDYPDWIELYNGGTEAFDLGGMYMTDDLSDPDDWQFPSDTVIEAGGYLVIWADNLPERGLLHASFGLNASGEAIGLFAGDGETEIDSIVFNAQPDDVSYGRLPDGDSSWSYLTPTLGLSNSLGEPVNPGDPTQPVEVPEHLYINEFMANNDAAVAGDYGDYPDWIELYNGGTESIDVGGMYLTGNLANPDAWQFAEGTVIDAGGFLVVWADNNPERGSLHASFSLNTNGDAIGLFASDGETEIDSIVFEAQFDDVAYGRLPDGTADWVYLTPTPSSSNELGEIVNPSDPVQPEVPEHLYINEFMANNDAAVAGPDGDYPDWIELYNGGTESIDVGGMYLSDNLANPDAWQFAEGTVIDAGGFLVVWADNDPEKGPMHANFGLNASGEAVGLFASDGETEIDSIVFNAQLNDVSYGRLPDGSANWTCLTPTPGSQNEEGESNGGPTEPVDEVPEGLVINEFMADNAATIAGPDGNSPDWIELYNGGNESVNLGGMYLTDDLNDPMKWRLPDDTIIEAEGFLLIWADNASDSDGLHCGFGLRANGEDIALFASDGTTLIDSITYTKQLQDVSYGRLPDGSENWEHMLSATPGWGNNKRQYDAASSLWAVLLLVGLVGVVCAVFVVGIKLNARRE